MAVTLEGGRLYLHALRGALRAALVSLTAILVLALVAVPARAATVVQGTSINNLVQYHRLYTDKVQRNYWSPSLSDIACAHAWRMAKAGRIFHEDISKKVPYRWAWLGQNVGMTTSTDLSSLYPAYRASATHHAVFHYRYSNRMGDCAVRYNGAWWHVHNFAQRV